MAAIRVSPKISSHFISNAQTVEKKQTKVFFKSFKKKKRNQTNAIRVSPQDLDPLHLKRTDSGEKADKIYKIKRNQTNAIRVKPPRSRPTSSLEGWTENTRTAVDKILKSGLKSSKENQETRLKSQRCGISN